MTHKPPQGIDAPNCPHKVKKQMVGEFVYYICECGQKFRAWNGKVSVLAPPAPRKDLAALEELVAKWRDKKGFALAEAARNQCANELEQRLAEMRGAKR